MKGRVSPGDSYLLKYLHDNFIPAWDIGTRRWVKQHSLTFAQCVIKASSNEYFVPLVEK